MTETTFDPLDPVHRPDPHPLYHRMRVQAPVYRGIDPATGEPRWFLTRYADVQRALHLPELARDLGRLPEPLAAPHRRARNQARAALGLDRHLLNLDPPDHTRLRRLVTPAFGARTTAALAPRIEQLTAELLGPVERAAHAGDRVDLIDALALPLPVLVIAELLGIPIDDRGQFRGWVDAMLRGGDEPGRQATSALISYLDEWIDRRRAAPGDDLLSQLIQVEQAGDRLSRAELRASVFLLLVAGHETSVNLIGNGVLELLRHPDQLARLRARPELIGSTVEEVLRFNGPVEATTLRYPLADVHFDGVVVPQGAAVMPLLLAANRDPAVFGQPDRFDITREPNRHLGFGHGIHFCLGAPLARLEGRIALAELVGRLPGLALAVPPTGLEWISGFPVRGLRRLPVVTR